MKAAQAHKRFIAQARKRGIKGSPVSQRVREIMGLGFNLKVAEFISIKFELLNYEDLQFLFLDHARRTKMFKTTDTLWSAIVTYESVAPIIAQGHSLKTALKIANRQDEIIMRANRREQDDHDTLTLWDSLNWDT